MLAELSRAGWSFSRLHFHLWGLRCYFLLPGVPSSLRWAGCQMVPLLAATGSQCNCEVILLLQGLLRPVDQGFFRSVRPTPFNALPKKDFSPSCTDSPQGLGQTALGWGDGNAEGDFFLPAQSFRGLEVLSCNNSPIWCSFTKIGSQKKRDGAWFYKISLSQWDIIRRS